MARPGDFGIGVIEGFFGTPWSWPDRTGYADFLSGQGFDFYIYAPKADAHLRRHWRAASPQADVDRLAATAAAYRARKLNFGIGLSPYEIYLDPEALDPGSSARADLRAKVARLNEIGPDILSILFDDMRGDVPNLAALQARLVAEVAEASTASAIVMCPTYYSFDPRLEKVFGKAPENYWTDLGRLLDPSVAVFWTGPEVTSRQYPRDHLTAVAEMLRRKPFLWDNYPVNDGAETSDHLHLGAFRGRPAELGDLLSGHAVNPMNQAWLSRIPLSTLAESYRRAGSYDPDRAFTAACRALCGVRLGARIARDRDLFQKSGLSAITDNVRSELIKKYTTYDDSPYAGEIVSWLEGAYVFDPTCLTG